MDAATAGGMRDVPLGTLIFRAGLLAEEQVEDALQEGMRTGKRLGEVLLERGWLHERDLGRLLAGQKGLPFIELGAISPDPAAVRMLPEEKARFQTALPIALEGGVPVVAVADPSNNLVIENLRRGLNTEPRLVVAAYSELVRKIEHAYAAVPAAAPQPAPEPQAVTAPPVEAPAPVAPPVSVPEPVAQPVAEQLPAPTVAPMPTVLPPAETLVPEPVESLTPPVAPPAAPAAITSPELEALVVEPLVTQPVGPPPAVVEPAAVEEVAPLQPAVLEPQAPAPAPVEPPPAPVTPEVDSLQVAPMPVAPPPMTETPAPLLDVEPVEPSAPAVTEQPVFEQPVYEQPQPVVEEPPVEQPVLETSPNGSPAPSNPHFVVLRLSDGEHLEVGTFGSGDEAQGFAQEVVRQIAATEGESAWPFFAGRFLRPETIASVDVIAESQEQWMGSQIRSRWAQ